METTEIVIGHVEIDVDIGKIKKNLVKNDDNLIDVINDYKSDLDPDIEIFEQFHNAIVTEEGWYIAVYPEKLKEIQDG